MSNEIEGAMPPLPEPKVLRLVDNEGFSDEAPYIWGFFAHGYDTGMEPYFSDDQMHAYAKAYAAPLIARVAELQAQNEAQKNEWLSWNEKRTALEKDAARWKAVRDHWKKANFTFRRDPANLLKAINLTVDFGHYTGGGASEIEREFDAAIAAKD